jgi:Flp pilus assembly protein TadD
MDLNSQGLVLLEKGNTAEALEYFRHALEVEPDNEDIARNATRAEQQLRWEEIDRAATAINEQGNQAYRKGSLDEARGYYLKALDLEPDDPVLKRNLKNVDDTLRRRHMAEVANTLNEQGNQAYRNGKLEEAREYYRKALEVNPGEPTIVRNWKDANDGLAREAKALAQMHAAHSRVSSRLATLFAAASNPRLQDAGPSTGSGSESLSFVNGTAAEELESASHAGAAARASDDLEFIKGTEARKVVEIPGDSVASRDPSVGTVRVGGRTSGADSLSPELRSTWGHTPEGKKLIDSEGAYKSQLSRANAKVAAIKRRRDTSTDPAVRRQASVDYVKAVDARDRVQQHLYVTQIAIEKKAKDYVLK